MHCSSLTVANGQVTLSNGLREGSIASYSCNANYYWSGLRNVRTCMNDGQWSAITGQCSKFTAQISIIYCCDFP